MPKKAVEIEVKELTRERFSGRIRGVPLPVVNALRRAAQSEVLTMAADYVIFYDNNTVLYDEYIAHRIAMIPLTSDAALEKYKRPEECVTDGSRFEEDCYATLRLVVERPGETPLSGLTEMEIIYSDSILSEDPDVKPISGKIPVAVISPGQRIHAEIKARLGRGREHAKWQAATVSVLTYVADIRIDWERCDNCGDCAAVCPTGALKNVKGRLKVDSERCNLCRQCLKACPAGAIRLSWRDGEYNLMIESSGALHAGRILYEAAKEVRSKLLTLLNIVNTLGGGTEGSGSG